MHTAIANVLISALVNIGDVQISGRGEYFSLTQKMTLKRGLTPEVL